MSNCLRILIVEDDLELQGQLRRRFERLDHRVHATSDGYEALYYAKEYEVDLAIIDLGLPKIDGIELIKRLRDDDHNFPTLILTARSGWKAKVAGLDSGADDYLAKPFDMQELLARLRVMERRLGTATSSLITIGNVVLDLATHQVTADNNEKELSRREFMLLKALMENAGRIQSKSQLETKLYEWGDELSSNAIEVHIHNLRKKLPKDFIKTIRGVGYSVTNRVSA